MIQGKSNQHNSNCTEYVVDHKYLNAEIPCDMISHGNKTSVDNKMVKLNHGINQVSTWFDLFMEINRFKRAKDI